MTAEQAPWTLGSVFRQYAANYAATGPENERGAYSQNEVAGTMQRFFRPSHPRQC